MKSEHKYLNKQFTTTSGQTGVVVKYVNSKEVYFKFDATGWVGCFSMDNIRSGKVKDKMFPSVCGTGFIGDGEYKASVKGKRDKSYLSWMGMIQGCYDEKYMEMQSTHKGYSVVEEWHNYQNYAEWYYDNLPDDGKEYRVSRMDAIYGDKIFSPESCCLVPVGRKQKFPKQKIHKFKSPDGEVFEVTNVLKFCKEHGLHNGAMGYVSKEMAYHHKGWTKA
jgi:hypothetical protein